MPLTGYTTALPADVLLDSGMLYVGSAQISATRGGLSFDPGKEFRVLEYDGLRTEVLGIRRITRWNAAIKGAFLQFKAANVTNFIPGATTGTGGTGVSTLITPKAAGLQYASGDYLSNLRLVFERGDTASTKYLAVLFTRALCIKYDIGSQMDGEGLINAEFRAVLQTTDASNIAPFVIEERSALP